MDNDIQASNKILNESLGDTNETYRGLHEWFQEDLKANLFPEIGRLLAEELGRNPELLESLKKNGGEQQLEQNRLFFEQVYPKK